MGVTLAKRVLIDHRKSRICLIDDPRNGGVQKRSVGCGEFARRLSRNYSVELHPSTLLQNSSKNSTTSAPS